MDAAVQRKEGDKAAKTIVKIAPELQAQENAETGAAVGVPLFLLGSRQSGAALPPTSSGVTSPLQRQIHGEVKDKEQPHPFFQAKLTIGQPNDKYEQEADRVADRVMSMSEAKLQCQVGVDGSGEENIEASPLADQITPLVQRQEVRPDEEGALLQAKSNLSESLKIASNLESRISSMKNGGQPLDPASRAFFESRFGYNFSRVRVHSGSVAADATKSINARAFTIGNHVAMGSGEYQPSSQSGQRLLSHELAHVVQQNGGNRTADHLRLSAAGGRPIVQAISDRSTSNLVQCAPPTAAADERQRIVTRLPVTADSRVYWVELIERGGGRFLRVTLEGTAERLEVQLAQNVPARAVATLNSKTIGPNESNVIINLSSGNITRGYWVKIEPSPYAPTSEAGRPDRVSLFNGDNIAGKDFFPRGAPARLSPTDARFSTAVALPPSGRAVNSASMVLELSPRSSGGGAWLILKLLKTGQLARILLPAANASQGTIRLAEQRDPGQDTRGNARRETNLEFRDNDNSLSRRRVRVLFTSWASTGNVQEGYTYSVTDLSAPSEQRGGFTVPPSSTSAADFHRQVLATGDPNVRSTVSGDQTLATEITARQAGGLRLQFWRSSPTASQIRFVLTSTSSNQSQSFTIPYNKPTLRPRIVEATGDAQGQLLVNLDGGTAKELIVGWRRSTTNHEYPFLEGAGHVVLRNFQTTELALLVTGTSMEVWNSRWYAPALPDNAIAPPKWRMFSNGYEAGWISNVNNTWIPNRLLYPQIQGARIGQMLFEQTAISGIRMIPVVGAIVMIGEAIAGREIITGRQMGTEERWVHGLLGGLVLILDAVVIIRGLSGPARQVQVANEVSRIRGATGMSETEARSLLDAGENLSASDRAFVQAAHNDLQAGRLLDAARAARLQRIVRNMNTALQEARSALHGILEARIEQINAARGDLNLFRARVRQLTLGGNTARPLSDVAASVDELLTPFRRVRTVAGGGRGSSGVSTYIESLDGRFSVRITHNQVGAAPVGQPALSRIHIYEGAVSGHGRHVVLPSGTTLTDILTALGL